jgi:cytosine/adenosine deaminase-related metal-dependent hydrolase
MPADLRVNNVRPLGGDLADILILAGRIARGPAPAGVPVLDGGGRIALPGLVEAHTHLDKSLLGLPWYRNEVGPRLIDKIENERKVRKSLPIDPRQQSERQAHLSVSHGSTFIRSHVDVDTECGVAGIEGVMATRETFTGIVDIACRVNRPSPKLRRQIGIRRAICRNVPQQNPQACCANACGSWAFSRSRKWRRVFGPEPTGAAIGTGI